MKLLVTLCMSLFGFACGADGEMTTLESAAHSGDVSAQERLAAHYFVGDGVPFDQEKAVYWYRQAAAQNSRYGFYQLGSSYEFGHGVAPDVHVAARYYEQAARLNSGHAQGALARLYASGALGEKDYLQSHVWQILSARHGFMIGHVDYRAAENLNAAQIALAEAAARQIIAAF